MAEDMVSSPREQAQLKKALSELVKIRLAEREANSALEKIRAELSTLHCESGETGGETDVVPVEREDPQHPHDLLFERLHTLKSRLHEAEALQSKHTESYRVEIQALRTALETSEQACVDMKIELQVVSDQLAIKDEELSSHVTTIEGLKAEKLSELEAIAKRLEQREAEFAEREREHQRTIVEMQSEIERITSEVSNLLPSVEVSKRLQVDLQTCEAMLKDLEEKEKERTRECEQLGSELTSLAAKHTAAESDRDQARAQLQELQTHLEETTEEVRNLTSQTESERCRADRAELDVAELKDRLELIETATSEEASVLRESIGVAEQRASEADQRAADAEKRAVDLEQSVIDAQKMSGGLRKALEDMEQQMTSMAKKHEEDSIRVWPMDEVIVRYVEKERQTSSSLASVLPSKVSLSAHKCSAEDMFKILRKVLSINLASVQGREKTEALLQEQVSELKKAASEARDASDAIRASLTAKCDLYEAQIGALTTENTHAKEALRIESEAKATAERVAEARVNKAISDLTAAQSVVDELKGEIASLQNKMKTVTEEVASPDLSSTRADSPLLSKVGTLKANSSTVACSSMMNRPYITTAVAVGTGVYIGMQLSSLMA